MKRILQLSVFRPREGKALKNILNGFIICIALAWQHSAVEAQLSGTYTINPNTSASGSNYTNLNSAISDLLAGSRSGTLNGTTLDGGAANGPGVSGAVTFLIKNGTAGTAQTFTEYLTISKVTGASATNTVTFQGAGLNSSSVTDSSMIVITNSGSNPTLYLDYASYITFKNVTLSTTANIEDIKIDGSGSSSSYGCTNDNFFHCQLIGYSSATTTATQSVVYMYESGINKTDSNIVFRNNLVQYGSSAFYIYGWSSGANAEKHIVIDSNQIKNTYYYPIYEPQYTSRNIISSNVFTDVCATAGYYCMYFSNTQSIDVYDNSMQSWTAAPHAAIYATSCTSTDFSRNTIAGLASSGASSYAIYMGSEFTNGKIDSNSISFTSGTTPAAGLYLTSNYVPVRIAANKIFIPGGTKANTGVNSTPNYAGIEIINGIGSSTSFSQIVNNMITIGGTNISYGIAWDYSNPIDANFFYNTILLTNTNASSSCLMGYYCCSANVIPVYDNILVNTGGGYCIDLANWSYVNDGYIGDYNDFYSSGSYVGYQASYGNVSFASWKTDGATPGWDQHSKNINPTFTSPSTGDLHTSTTALKVGKPESTIAYDIDGVSRANPPTIGANEIAGTSCLSGTYTIGGSGANYATFNAAVAALDSYGVCGPVTFSVANGTYNEQISIPPISGVSSANTITFQGVSSDSSLAVLTYAGTGAADNYVVALNGAKYIKFRKITFSNTGSLYSTVLNYTNGANHDTVKQCQLISPAISSTNTNNAVVYAPVGSSIANACDSDVFIGNAIENGSISIDWNGYSNRLANNGTGLVLKNNVITNSYYAGLYLSYCTGFNFSGNNFNTNSIYASYNGMNLYYCDGGGTVNGNHITAAHANGYGIYVQWANWASMINPGVVFSNNMIILGSSGTNISYGIYNYYAMSQAFYFNSVNIVGTGTTSTYAMNEYAQTINNSAAANCENNVFSNSSSGNGYVMYLSNSSYCGTINYNDYYLATGTHMFNYGGTSVSSYSSWKTTYVTTDIDSKTINPGFVSNTSNLHATNDTLSGAAVSISGITTDIDGVTRSNPPTIGANELAAPSSITARFYVNDTNCLYSAVSFMDSSKISSCGTINHWLWSFGDGDTSTAHNPSHTYTSAGSYSIKLTVSSTGSCTDSIVKSIYIDSTCVWPGDANKNKTVEITDILNIGVAYNDTGAKRIIRNNTWQGDYSKNWSNNFLSGANYKHADCNGDGKVDSLDIMAISLNWGDTHPKTGLTSTGNPTDPPLYLQFTKDSFPAGDTVKANIMLGTNSLQVQNVYGIAFVLNYGIKYVDSGSVATVVPSSWLGTPGKNLISFVHNDYAKGQLSVAMVRTDHTNVSGFGLVGTVSIVMPDNIAGKTYINRTVIFKTIQVKAIESNETPVEIYMPDDSFIAYQVMGIHAAPDNITGMNIYPNPTHDNLYIDAGSHTILSATVFDALGKQVLATEMKEGKSAIIPVSSLPQGVYMVRLIMEGGEYITRFIKN